MTKKEVKSKLTLNDAITLKKTLTEEVKYIGRELKQNPTKVLFRKLEEKEENLKRISLAILKINSDLDNNTLIKERDIIVRQKEVVKGILSNYKRPESVISKVKKVLGIDKNKLQEKELEALLLEYENKIYKIDKQLNKFNSSNTIKVDLLNV